MTEFDITQQVRIDDPKTVRIQSFLLDATARSARFRVHPLHDSRAFKRDPEVEEQKAFESEIAAQGVRDPIIITKEYEILNGLRRTRAAWKAGHKTIPARVAHPENDFQVTNLIVAYNANRKQPYTWEEQTALILQHFPKDYLLSDGRASDKYGTKYRKDELIAAATGFHPSRVRQLLSAIRSDLKGGGRSLSGPRQFTESQLDTLQQRLEEFDALSAKMAPIERELEKLQNASTRLYDTYIVRVNDVAGGSGRTNGGAQRRNVSDPPAMCPQPGPARAL